MNHRKLSSHKHLLWLVVGVAFIILGVLFIRPPAWAGPLDAPHLLTTLATEVSSATPSALGEAPDQTSGAAHMLTVSDAPASASGATHITLQADTPSSDNCIACHTDKKKLKAVAEEPEEVKSTEAAGEG